MKLICCEGVYNMDLDEASECAELVQAKHNIPYHIVEAENPDHLRRCCCTSEHGMI